MVHKHTKSLILIKILIRYNHVTVHTNMIIPNNVKKILLTYQLLHTTVDILDRIAEFLVKHLIRS